MPNLWIKGDSLSGKTNFLVQQFCEWAEQDFANHANPQARSQTVLVLAVDATARKTLSDRLSLSTHGKYPVTSATPLSFFRDQVLLFFPLLMEILNLKAQFPILLRVENEQELATQVWAERFNSGLNMAGVSPNRLVRRLLDIYLLAAYSGKNLEDIPQILSQGIEPIIPVEFLDDPEPALVINQELWQHVGIALTDWQEFCWQNGLLTYGVITELFGKYLLPHPQYQASLRQKYHYLLIDDTDEYPAIAGNLCSLLLDQGAQGVFSFNPNGSARLGLGADPEYWQQNVESRCEIIDLPPCSGTLAETALEPVMAVVERNLGLEQIEGFLIIETISRGKLLRNLGDFIGDAIASGQIKPSQIAIIAPGLDNIANYALTEILSKKQISVISLNDQRPLAASSQVRSLLTLLALVYPNLGHLISPDQVAEMLVNFDQAIDPVRASMLSDRCFLPHPSAPKLLPSHTHSEWQRLGYEVSQAYEQIRAWINAQSNRTAPLLLLDRTIQTFLSPGALVYEKLANLQELMETAQYYWNIGYRLGWQESVILERFINLISQGIVTANPYAPNLPEESVTLATIYQYRMAHTQHRWQFWLDTGSILWKKGGAATLYAAPLFLQNWKGVPWTITEENEEDRLRLQRLLKDLLSRTQARIYLCYSELNTSGQIQMGELLALKDIASSDI